MGQRIRFCTSVGGVRIAYAEVGQGPPVVRVLNWLTHLDHDWDGPVWRHWQAELSRDHRLISYDSRGCGLSDRDVEDISLEAWIADLEAVIDDLGLERVTLMGLCRGGAISVAYASRHPERVSRLVIYGGYARGRFHRDPTAEHRQRAETLLGCIRHGWGQSNPAFRRVFSSLLLPNASREQERWFDDLQRITADPEMAARIQRTAYMLDVSDMARQIRAPTLILHARGDAAVPLEEGRLLAGLIPHAQFVPLDSQNHVLLRDEPAWGHFLREVREFLGPPGADPPRSLLTLTGREREVLELIARGLSNSEIADYLAIAPKTVRNHVAHIYDKLDSRNRAHAVVLAREAGYGRADLPS